MERHEELGRDAGGLDGADNTEESDSGARPAPWARWSHSAEVELDKLRRRHERTEAELARTRLALDLMGKRRALELVAESADSDKPSPR